MRPPGVWGVQTDDVGPRIAIASLPMPTLKSRIEDLASTFAAGVLAAVHSSSLEEILAGGWGSSGDRAPAKRGPGRPKKAAVVAGGGGMPDPLKTPAKAKRGQGGRLLRRSPSDIQLVIGLIVGKLGEHRAGLRSEQLQKALKLDKKDVSGPILQALKEKKIVKTGKKRSTTYFAK